MRRNMKYVAAAIILFSLALSSGCSSKDITRYNYNYQGESTNWKAEYKGHSTVEFYKEKGMLKYRGKGEGNLIFSYKGNLSELSPVREIEWKFEGFGGGKTNYDKGPEGKTFSYNLGIEGPTDEYENLEIKIYGKTETIKMRNVK